MLAQEAYRTYRKLDSAEVPAWLASCRGLREIG
jgi:hypothetical protein